MITGTEGLWQVVADDQSKGHNGRPQQEGNAPTPSVQDCWSHQKSQKEANNTRHQHGQVLSGHLQADIEPSAIWGCRLDQEGRRGAHLSTQGKPLEEAEKNQQNRSPDTDLCISRRQDEAKYRNAH